MSPYQNRINAMKTLLCSVLLGLCVACINETQQSTPTAGSGEWYRESRSVTAFDRVQVDGMYHVVITCGKPYSLNLEGDNNIVPLVITEVKDRVLHIYTNQSISPQLLLTAEINLPDLKGLGASGSTQITLDSVDNQTLDIELSGAAQFIGSGKTQMLTITAAGSVQVNTELLLSRNAKVQMSGAGSVKLNVQESLDVTIAGVGNVEYTGGATVTHQDISGLGSITAK
jgi:hypothetical protein